MFAIERILVAIDFSPDATFALSLAKETAHRFRSEVVLLHVEDELAAAPLSPEAAARRQEVRLILERSRADLSQDDIRAQILMLPGDPALEILRVAEDKRVGMVVLGTHGSTSATSLLLGSVADRVLRHSVAPVLLVRHPSRRVSRSVSALQRRGGSDRPFSGTLQGAPVKGPDGEG